MGGMMAKALAGLFADCQRAQALVDGLAELASDRHVSCQRIESVSEAPGNFAPVFRWSIHFHSYQDMKRFSEIVLSMVSGASSDE